MSAPAPRHRRGRGRGFSLVELMVSLALGGLLVAGAFELNRTFNTQAVRQNQIADMQQSLRVSRQIIERALRGAGGGLLGAPLLFRAAAVQTFHPIQFSNSNLLPALPKNAGFDNVRGDEDLDPDWLQVVSADPGLGGTIDALGTVNVLQLAQFGVGDLFVAVNPSTTVGIPRFNCVRQVTGVVAPGGMCPGCGRLLHALNPANPAPDPCLTAPGPNPEPFTFPAAVRRLGPSAVSMFRVETQANQPCCLNCLCASFHAIGAAPVWQLVAENIEDMQIALVMRSGEVCGTRDPVTQVLNSIDDPALCPPQFARAVRLTLTARSSTSVPGFALGQSGGIEDQPLVGLAPGADQFGVPLANYLRRTLTAEVELRNGMP